MSIGRRSLGERGAPSSERLRLRGTTNSDLSPSRAVGLTDCQTETYKTETIEEQCRTNQTDVRDGAGVTHGPRCRKRLLSRAESSQLSSLPQTADHCRSSSPRRLRTVELSLG